MLKMLSYAKIFADNIFCPYICIAKTKTLRGHGRKTITRRINIMKNLSTKYMMIMKGVCVAVGRFAPLMLAIMSDHDYDAYGRSFTLHEVTFEGEHGTFCKPEPAFKGTLAGVRKGKLPKAV